MGLADPITRHRELRLRGIVTGEPRAFDKAKHPRDGDGKFADVPGVGAGTALDRLKLAGRIDLRPGEELVSSGKLDTDNGSIRVAVTRRDGQPHLRIAAEYSDTGLPKWSGNEPRTAALQADRERLQAELDQLGEDDPRYDELAGQLDELGDEDWNTAQLDATAAEGLRTRLQSALATAADAEMAETKRWDEVDRLERDRDRLRYMGRKWTDEEDARWDSLTEQIEALRAGAGGFSEDGVVPGEWGDVHFQVFVDDQGAQALIGVKPHGVDADWEQTRDWRGTFSAAELRKILKLIDPATPQAT